MTGWVKQMFSWWSSRHSEPEDDGYVPTQEQLYVAQQQEQLKDEIRLRALQANVNVLRSRQWDVNEHDNYH